MSVFRARQAYMHATCKGKGSPIDYNSNPDLLLVVQFHVWVFVLRPTKRVEDELYDRRQTVLPV